MERCVAGADCNDPNCFHLHPCTGSNCGHKGNVWLPQDHFKRNRNKRFRTCRALAVTNKDYQSKNPRYEMRGEMSEEEKAAVQVAKKEFDRLLTQAQEAHPGCTLSCNIFGASTGSAGYSIKQEGTASTLIERGYDTPAIVAATYSSSRPWRALNGKERRDLGPPAETVFDVGTSKKLSKCVETQLQLHAQKQPGLQRLWRVVGAGMPKGAPPYCVGVRFFF